MSSKAAVSQIAKRLPSKVVLVRSTGLLPSKAASARAASSTERQSGPTVSNRAQSGTTPCKEIRPLVVFSPTKSFHAAGIRTDPPVSEPNAIGARPKATEAAAPEEDPPETAV